MTINLKEMKDDILAKPFTADVLLTHGGEFDAEDVFITAFLAMATKLSSEEEDDPEHIDRAVLCIPSEIVIAQEDHSHKSHKKRNERFKRYHHGVAVYVYREPDNTKHDYIKKIGDVDEIYAYRRGRGRKYKSGKKFADVWKEYGNVKNLPRFTEFTSKVSDLFEGVIGFYGKPLSYTADECEEYLLKDNDRFKNAVNFAYNVIHQALFSELSKNYGIKK